MSSLAVHYALDFGNTNSVIASDRGGVVAPLTLSGISTERVRTPVIPSACLIIEGAPPLIGQAAISQNLFGRLPSFAHGFKRRLGQQSASAVALVDGAPLSARLAAQAFFDGLRTAARQELRPRRKGIPGLWDEWLERRDPLLSDLTLTVPVDADELYRRELARLGQRLGAKTIRLLDEPIAAAIGYGVNLDHEAVILVVDWGGGTLDVSVVQTEADATTRGRVNVLAKAASPVGGQDVDAWIVERFLIPVSTYISEFEVDALHAAVAAKEAASIEGLGSFRFRTRSAMPLTREDLCLILTEHGAYDSLRWSISDALSQLESKHGMQSGSINYALLVGGSSLLPGVDEMIRASLPLAQVSEWNVFAAVAEGACHFARGTRLEDRIHHDYALRLADETSRTVYYELIFPAGTAYPTVEPSSVRDYRPDDSEPRRMFFEVGEIARLGRPAVEWSADAHGRRTWRPRDPSDHSRFLQISGDQSVLRLPTTLDKSQTVKVAYSLDADRFLRWTVTAGTNVLRQDDVLGRLR